MPIYEYSCAKCEHHFEELVFSQREKVTCPECGSAKVERALSVFSYSSGGSYRSSAGDGCGSCHKSSCAGCGSGGH
jgi:putative FmdB family regulatory protein